MALWSSLALLLLLLIIVGPLGGGVGAEVENKKDGVTVWCVAKNNAEDAALQDALDWACGPLGGADCKPIQLGGPCYQPQDLQSHASYAFNDYFIRHASAPQACDFSGNAALISIDPSHDNCRFPSSSAAGNGSFSGSSSNSGFAVNDTSDSLLLHKAWTLAVTSVLIAVALAPVR